MEQLYRFDTATRRGENFAWKIYWAEAILGFTKIMFAFVITCPACGYESASFAEGLDIHENTFTVLFMKTSDKTFRVEVVDEHKMKTYGGDLDSGMGVDAAIRALAAPGEEPINLPFGRDASFAARCPNCSRVELNRKITGLV